MCLHLCSEVIIENDLSGFNELHGLELHSKEIVNYLLVVIGQGGGRSNKS